MTYKRYENETDEELIYRVCSDHALIGTWQQVADILNKLLDCDYGESTYRKKYAAFQKMFEANRSKLIDNAELLGEVKEEERRLERERIRYRDERHAWNKQNYIDARVTNKLDLLEDALKEIGRHEFPRSNDNIVVFDANRAVVVMLSDLHIGATFDTYFGHYDVDVAEDRLQELFAEVVKIAKRHAANVCYVLMNGDDISGNIHRSIQVSNRENVIDQIKIATELVANFCYELSQEFNMVRLAGVSGNHSRIDRKEDALKDERLDRLIPWAVGLTLGDVPNFEVIDDANIDSTIAIVDICGKEYVLVHGDHDSFTKTGVQSLVTMIGSVPYAVLFGHLHTPAVDECNGIKMIRGGSLAGSGDDFTIQKRLGGDPSQMVFVADANGVEAYYPIKLN